MKIYYYLISILAGVAVAFQTGVNAQLRTDTNNAVLTALISFAVGSIALLILYVTFFRQSPVFPQEYSFAWWKFTGGLLGAVYVTGVVLAAPRIGAANALAFIVGGQFIMAIIIDQLWMDAASCQSDLGIPCGGNYSVACRCVLNPEKMILKKV